MRAKIGAKNDQFLPYFFPRFYRCIEAKKRFLSILGQNSEKGKETGMEKKQHPSYGMIRFARSSIGGSGTALFGSSIMHNNVIRLSISKGMMEREVNEDWFLAGTDINDMIVEVEMSYTQFAEAITSLNIGEGIPVTITKVNGTFVEPCPYSDRQKVMRREVDEATRDLVRQLEKRSEEIDNAPNVLKAVCHA